MRKSMMTNWLRSCCHLESAEFSGPIDTGTSRKRAVVKMSEMKVLHGTLTVS
jgi:hypothetical protein